MSKMFLKFKRNFFNFYQPFNRQRDSTVDYHELGADVCLAAMGVLLPNAIVLGGISPFGIAFFASFLFKKNKFYAYLATVIGYIFAFQSINSIKYVATLTILLVFAKMLKKGSKSNDDLYMVPLLSATTLLAMGGITVALRGFLLLDILMIFAECLICFLCCVLFATTVPAIKNLSYERVLKKTSITGILVLLSLSIIPLISVKIGDISVGRVLGIMMVLGMAFSTNASFATMCGTIVGISVGLVNNNFMILCTSYGVSALVASIFSIHSKFLGLLSFVVTHGIICIYGAPTEFAVIWLYEVLIAAIFTMFVPVSNLKFIMEKGKLSLTNPLHENKVKEITISRLKSLSEGFREVYETVLYVSDRLKKTNFYDPLTVFDSASQKVCKSCKYNDYCYSEDYERTRGNFNKLLPELSKNGQISERELKNQFGGVCLKSEELTKEINVTYSKFMLRRKIKEEQELQRGLECEQFIGISGAIEQMARELDECYTFDTDAESRISAYLDGNDLHPIGVMVMIDKDDKPRVEIDIKTIKEFRISTMAFCQKISGIIGYEVSSFDMENHNGYYKIVLTQKENFHPIYHYKTEIKSGENFSGDSPYVFRNNKGKMVMVLADGMGSGKRAAIDSTMAVKIIEKVLKCGFDSKSALSIVNSAMILSSGEGRTTAVDVSIIDLFDGKCDFIKAGGAPTYVKKGDIIHRLDNETIPTGIVEGIEPKVVTLELKQNDYVLMVSDGVVGYDDTFIIEAMKEENYRSPTELCAIILEKIKERDKSVFVDDTTVLAVKM